MLRVTQRLRRISESLVDFARVRKQQAESVFLRPLIDESWTLVGIDEKAAAVTFRNDVQSSAAVTGNPDRLGSGARKPIRDALLAVSTGGLITVESRLFREAVSIGSAAWSLTTGPASCRCASQSV